MTIHLVPTVPARKTGDLQTAARRAGVSEHDMALARHEPPIWWPLMGWPNFALAALGWAIIFGAVWLFLAVFT